jgi:hypothetical protein
LMHREKAPFRASATIRQRVRDDNHLALWS